MHDVAQEKYIAKVEEIDKVQDERDVAGKSVAHGDVGQHDGDGRRKIHRFSIVEDEGVKSFVRPAVVG